MGLKKFWDIMVKDYQEEDFTTGEKIMFGLIVPAMFMVVILLVSLLCE